MARPAAKVAACDISKAALALTAENRARLGLEAQVELIESDLLSSVHGPFEVIVANLPYIPSSEIPALSREVRHDPVSALDGGPDGLQLVERLVVEIPSRLVAGGLVALEIGHDQAERTIALLEAAGLQESTSHADHQGHQRFVTARQAG
jgi:release factor glutamine methyltransferase